MHARPRSLRLRIALLYGALAGVAVAIVAILGFLLLRQTQYNELDRSLRRSSQRVAAALSAAQSLRTSQQILDAFMHPDGIARLVNGTGEVVGQSRTGPTGASPGFCDAVQRADGACSVGTAAFDQALLRRAQFQTILDDKNRRWRVHFVALNGGSHFLATMLPLADTDRAADVVAYWMILIAFTATAGSILTGWWLAPRALRPVAILTAGAANQSRAFSRRSADEKGHDELARLAFTFDDMLATLQRANESQKGFIAAASHELRAPLTIIRANLELLGNADRMRGDDKAAAVAEAHGEAERMGRLVTSLLVLARADAGMPLSHKPVELDRVVLEVVTELRHVVDKRTLEIAEFEPVVVQGDADRLKQLVLILLDNAVKYTLDDQRVTVELRHEAAHALLSVRDTGVGIHPDALSQVFDRFYRADDARALDPGGTGLGLPIARMIVEEHGGSVALASTPGHGTTATVRIPLSGSS